MIALSEKQWKIAIPIACVLALALLALFFWVYSDGHKKEGELIGNIGIEQGKNAVIANLVTNQEKAVNAAEQESKNAETNFNQSVNRDSSTFNGGFDESTNAFCRRFACDSGCAEWRKINRPHLFCPGR